MFVGHMCVWYPKRPEDGIDPLELEVCAVVSHHVGART